MYQPCTTLYYLSDRGATPCFVSMSHSAPRTQCLRECLTVRPHALGEQGYCCTTSSVLVVLSLILMLIWRGRTNTAAHGYRVSSQFINTRPVLQDFAECFELSSWCLISLGASWPVGICNFQQPDKCVQSVSGVCRSGVCL